MRLFNNGRTEEGRVRTDHPLRRVAAAVELNLVREEWRIAMEATANVSVDPVVILKMMCLLFFDDVSSERELTKVTAKRLDTFGF